MTFTKEEMEYISKGLDELRSHMIEKALDEAVKGNTVLLSIIAYHLDRIDDLNKKVETGV